MSKHGLSREIILYWDKLFSFKFLKALMAQLGIKYKLSTACYSQTDEQTERINQMLE